MRKRVYISADYSEDNGDRDVVDVLHMWSEDNYHKVNYIDTAEVVSGSVSNDPDCRACDLKKEFNKQINASSTTIFVVGDKTSDRNAGDSCKRNSVGPGCDCTPYKQNTNGKKICKCYYVCKPGPEEDLGYINSYSYIEHEFKQSKRKGKKIIVVYNSLNKQPGWLPSYMREYEDVAQPFWIRNYYGEKVGNYEFIKKALGYD